MFEPESLQLALQTAIVAGIGAALAWAISALRNAARNYGKTEMELATAQVEEANKRMLEASMTPDLADDAQAQVKLQLAEAQFQFARRVQAITEGIANTAPKS